MREHIIEAVTVCVNYGDFLRAVAPYNSAIFDRWIIITEEEDTETREVCAKFNLHCILTKDHKRNGDDFNKGRIVDRALGHVAGIGWRMHIDADIALPNYFRRAIMWDNLDKNSVHGFDRIYVNGWEKWQELQTTGFLIGATRDYPQVLSFPAGFPVGSRINIHNTGWVPIGFAQLWHSDADEAFGNKIRPYPHHQGTACRADVQFPLQWDRANRVLIPEIIAVHLASEESKMGANWNGRTTKRFGPENLGAKNQLKKMQGPS
jgi:hypothetical protein